MVDFMTERLTKDAGESFAPSRYSLKSRNDAIISPYGSYDLFFEITFHVLQKLGAYEDIGTVEECRAALEKQIADKELESHDEKHILKYCISLMQELTDAFGEWYKWMHGEDAIKELSEEESFCYRMAYFHIVQKLFLFTTYHFGGTSTRAKCKQLGVDPSEEVEFDFGG